MPSNLLMKKFLLSLLESKLNKTYFFHNVCHTLYVMEKAFEIAQHENCTTAEIELVCTAALWHDVGFINIYDGHEEEGCKLVQKYLPEFGFFASSINLICGMIRATKIPQSPKNKLEQILADADLEYLGTANAASIANELFKELKFLDPLLSIAQWNQMQISFLQKHCYFTNYCKENKENTKQSYLKKLISNKF